MKTVISLQSEYFTDFENEIRTTKVGMDSRNDLTTRLFLILSLAFPAFWRFQSFRI